MPSFHLESLFLQNRIRQRIVFLMSLLIELVVPKVKMTERKKKSKRYISFYRSYFIMFAY